MILIVCEVIVVEVFFDCVLKIIFYLLSWGVVLWLVVFVCWVIVVLLLFFVGLVV